VLLLSNFAEKIVNVPVDGSTVPALLSVLFNDAVSWEDYVATVIDKGAWGKLQYSGGNLPQFQSVNHKSHVD
jgi:hypothetical protein